MSAARAIAVLTLMLLALPARAQLLSPGPLAKAHADLEGDTRCGACHSTGRQVDESKCLGCHRPLAARIQARAGLHGTRYRGQACGECHVEHLGVAARLVRWPGGDPRKLDHAQTGWPLAGAHAQVACDKCHDRHTESGAPTFLGLKTDCASCHRDPHDGRLGAACAGCHSEQRWADVRLEKLDHSLTRFPLRGAHQRTQCKACHGEPARWRGLAFAACSDCHKDPHAGRMQGACASCHVESDWKEVTAFRGAAHPGLSLGGGHAGVACAKCHDRGNDRPPSIGTSCVSCHPPVHEAAFGRDCKACHAQIRWLGLPARVGLDAHGKTAFPLRGAHEQVACGRCHPVARPPAQRYRGLAFDRCGACHADPHGGRLAGDCDACHRDTGFLPTRFGVAAHRASRFPLEGKHVAVACGACHGTVRPRVDLRVARAACADCHPNPHGEQFAVEMRAGGCAKCHSAAGWQRPVVDHSVFPLTGAHASVACESCHPRGGDFRGAPRDCAGCHLDPHAGQFRLAAPVRGCELCHDTAGFKIARFDHARLAGYPLEGKHAAVACGACHAKEALRPAGQAIGEAVRWRLGYRACEDCHADPHTAGGRRSLVAGLGCSTCHTTAGWRAAGGAGFDHSRTLFPLTFAHRAASCGACHRADREITRVCAGCHRDPHEGRFGDSCDGCHSPVSWNDLRVSERHRRTRLPLTGMHALLECSACHLRNDPRGYGEAPAQCFACHEADYRRDIHPDHTGRGGAAPFPHDCAQCHRATGWSPAVIEPSTALRALELAGEHERRFPIRAGKHRGAPCASCHIDKPETRAVSCTGCHAHSAARLAAQHRGQPSSACLSCHPGGAAR